MITFFPFEMSTEESTAPKPEDIVQSPEEVKQEVAPPIKTPRLRAAERQRLIDDFKSGKVSSDYEIITTKVEGKYVVRPRKQKLTDDQIKKVTPSKPTVNETPATILPSLQAKKKSTKLKS